MNLAAQLFTSEKLLHILSLSQNATAVYSGEDMVIQTANDMMISYWGKNREVIGFPLEIAVPELKGQPFIGLLQHVWLTGESYEARDTAAELFIDGKMQTLYFDFWYRVLKDVNGKVDCILHTATDVSDRVATRLFIEEAAAQKNALDTELALNGHLVSSNEELHWAKTALNTLNQELEERVQDRTKALTESESRLRSLITHAPVAIGVLMGRDLVIESANARILQVWGKAADIVGLRLAQALPELQGQPFLQLLDNVFTTGLPYYSDGAQASLEHEGVLKNYHFNFLFQPILNDKGTTESIFIVATDLTEQVKARQEIERSEEMQRFAIESAGVGTWHFYPNSKKFFPSGRFKEFFGFDTHEEITLAQVIAKIPEAYRHQVEAEISNAILNRAEYNVEHTISSFDDQKPRWIRAIGKLDSNDKDPCFTGIAIDITEQKQDEQRKNDFIGMVSHELKTPLTSLSGFLQLLLLKSKRTEDKFQTGVLEKAAKQVKKMTRMVHSFLTISRLAAGKIYLELEHFDIEALVEEIVEENRIAFPDHQINFQAITFTAVLADRDKIGQVITNFISNAVKYAPGSKTIDVACRKDHGQVTISISDYGIGIKPEDKSKLFERYYRVENSLAKNVAGFGIGLYLCAEIIERHQGKIGLESVWGNGSTFFFTLKDGSGVLSL